MAEENPKPTIPPPQQETPPPQQEPSPPQPEPPSEPPLKNQKEEEPPYTVVPESEPTAGTEVKQEDLPSLSEVQESEKELPPPQQEVEGPVLENPPAVKVAEQEVVEPVPENSPAVKVAEPEVSVTTSSAEESEKEKSSDERKVPQSLVSFKEESNIVADLSDSERKAFQELKQMVQDAVKNQVFGSPQSKEAENKASKGDESDVSTEMNPNTVREGGEEVVSIWGVPLLKDDRTDVILLKFLRARDFKVKDAFGMLKSTMQWRREFGIDALVDEDLGDDLDKVVFMHGYDRDGHPVCYNVYGEFQNKELYQKTFGDEEKREKFLRWRIQFLERSIRKLDFRPGGVNTIFQVNDLKNSPGPGKREHRIATKFALQLLQDNYPEFVAKQVFINVPWWYLAFYTMINPFLTQRTKSKFVFAGPSKTPETLFKYISPEHVPVQYGGLSVDYCDCNPEFTIADPATVMTVKPGTKQTVEIIVYEKCILVWELRVVGWEVSYSAEFTPNAKDAYTVIIEKPRKMTPSDEPVVSSSFKVSDLGKVLLTIDNPTSKKKKLIYRFKVNTLSD